tara:strand:- start:1398 stop:2153 length:756 start_codon:yes stop_codon:yes gene_type:complete
MRKILKKIFEILGYNISKIKKDKYPIDIPNETIKIYEEVEPYTATSLERVNALLQSVVYITENNIDGEIVECGVWKGGSCMAVAIKLMELEQKTREIWLYDTFEGMTEPTNHDIEIETGKKGKELLDGIDKNTDKYNMWAYAPKEVVINNMKKTRYPTDNIKYITGNVEKTLKERKPKKIALLRLDTDWYESTKAELEELYPHVVNGGIIIIDDYGHFEGAKRAVDEYFEKEDNKPLLNRIDYTGRLIVKK